MMGDDPACIAGRQHISLQLARFIGIARDDQDTRWCLHRRNACRTLRERNHIERGDRHTVTVILRNDGLSRRGLRTLRGTRLLERQRRRAAKNERGNQMEMHHFTRWAKPYFQPTRTNCEREMSSRGLFATGRVCQWLLLRACKDCKRGFNHTPIVKLIVGSARVFIALSDAKRPWRV